MLQLDTTMQANPLVSKDSFPVLKEIFFGKELCYLDSAATTHKPLIVVNAMQEFASKHNGTVRRGVYELSARSTEAFDDARLKLAKFLNVDDAAQLIFTRGTTESINLVAFSFSEAFITEGDSILLSAIEHHANIVPWQLACKRKKANLKVIPVKDNGELDLEAFDTLIQDPKLKILAVGHISNSLGTINPIKEMIAKAHQYKVPVLIDAAQSAGHMAIDIKDLNCDFLVFSAHKIYGPTGLGVLYGRRGLLEQMPPYHGGGEMIDKVSFEGTSFAGLPFKFEAGTPAITEVIGLGYTLDFLNSIGLNKINAYESGLHKYMEEQLLEIPNLNIIGRAKNKAAISSFVIDGIDAFDIGVFLNQEAIAIRTGHHCAQPTMQRFNVNATSRASIGLYNDKADIDRFVIGLKKVIELIGV